MAIDPKTFFEKAKAKGLTADEARQAWDDYTKVSETPEPEAPEQPEDESFGRTIKSLFPSTSKGLESGSLARTAIGAGVDILTGPQRIALAAGRAIDNPDLDYRESLEQINRGENRAGEPSVLTQLATSPAIPAARFAAPVAAKVGSMGKGLFQRGGALAAGGAIEAGAGAAAEQAKQYASTGEVSPGRFIGETAVGGVLAPVAGGVGRMFQGAGKGVAEAIPSTRGAVIIPPRRTPQGITLTPAQVAGDLTGPRGSLESFAQTNPLLADIPSSIEEANRAAGQASILGQRGVLARPPMRLEDITPSSTGSAIEEAAGKAAERLGQRFGVEQTLVSLEGGVSKMPVAAKEIKREASRILNDYGYSPRAGIRGTERASENAIGYVEGRIEQIPNLKTTKDLLAFKRNVAADVYADARKADPMFQGRDKSLFVEFERMLNNNISAQFANAVSKNILTAGEATAARRAWEAMNASYSQNREILESVSNGLGISSAKVNPEQYFNRIASIGAENLDALKKASTKDPDMATLYKEIQAGFFDNLLKRSTTINKAGGSDVLELSPDKLISSWKSMDNGVKNAIFPKDVIKEMDDAISAIAQSQAGIATRINPSGTARLSALREGANPKNWPVLALRKPLKRYYETGSLSGVESILNLIQPTGRTIEGIGTGTRLLADPTMGGQGGAAARQSLRSFLFSEE